MLHIVFLQADAVQTSLQGALLCDLFLRMDTVSMRLQNSIAVYALWLDPVCTFRHHCLPLASFLLVILSQSCFVN